MISKCISASENTNLTWSVSAACRRKEGLGSGVQASQTARAGNLNSVSARCSVAAATGVVEKINVPSIRFNVGCFTAASLTNLHVESERSPVIFSSGITLSAELLVEP